MVSQQERALHQQRVAEVKNRLKRAGIPMLPSETHIVPVMVGDAEACKAASDRLLERHGIYIQPINYPTVPRGTERLRITPGPLHTQVHIEALTQALVETWKALDLPFSGLVLDAQEHTQTAWKMEHGQ